MKFEDEIKALQTQVDKLTTLGINKIIALGHSGFTVDKEIAEKVRGVDVVIGGHTNTFLYEGKTVKKLPLHTDPRSLSNRKLMYYQQLLYCFLLTDSCLSV